MLVFPRKTRVHMSFNLTPLGFLLGMGRVHLSVSRVGSWVNNFQFGLMKFGSGQARVQFFSIFSVNFNRIWQYLGTKIFFGFKKFVLGYSGSKECVSGLVPYFLYPKPKYNPQTCNQCITKTTQYTTCTRRRSHRIRLSCSHKYYQRS